MAEQGLCIPAPDAMPELRLSLERRVKLHGIYNKNNVLAELRRLQQSFIAEAEAAIDKEALFAAVSFLESLALFLDSYSSDFSSLRSWQQLKREFEILEEITSFKDTADLRIRLKLWQQLVRVFAKVKQLEIRQELSGVFSSEGRITLYMNNIEAICHQQGLNMKPYLQSVLVHEYTHACHYAAFMETRLQHKTDKFALEKAMLCWSGAYFGKGRVTSVKESLARYMQILWCRLNDPCLSVELEKEAYGEYVIYPNWPYAGAQSILHLPEHEAKSLFNAIWQASLMNWEQAYELLGAYIDNVK